MRGTSPPSGTRDGFRDTMIFGYIDQTVGARANSSECFACMFFQRDRLRSESIDDDVELSVLADMITNLSERVAAAGGRGAAERDPCHHLQLLSLSDAARWQHRIGRGELDIH